MVSDVNTMDEASIKIRFNKLCQQFQNNEKYIKLSDENYEISDQENISYEMTVKNKLYDALFYQKPETNSGETLEQIKASLLSKYTKTAAAFCTNFLKYNLLQDCHPKITR